MNKQTKKYNKQIENHTHLQPPPPHTHTHKGRKKERGLLPMLMNFCKCSWFGSFSILRRSHTLYSALRLQ